MHGQDDHHVLRCGMCSKPFDKESSLKRHGYYCRSRKGGRVNRAKSCVACAKGKARCDNTHPSCSRCAKRGIECCYPAKGIDDRREFDRNGSVLRQANAQNPTPPKSQASPTADDATVVPDPLPIYESANLEQPSFDWDFSDVNFTDVDFLALEHQQNQPQYLGPIPTSSIATPESSKDRFVQPQSLGPTPSTSESLLSESLWDISKPSRDDISRIPYDQSSFQPSIQRLPTFTLRSLIQRPKIKAHAQVTAKLIGRILNSYPMMMLNYSSLPPFIHPAWLSSTSSERMEPLTNCMSLVHMASTRVAGSAKLFWRNVRQECDRMCSEHAKMDKWELVAATQALIIYLLMRMAEGETECNNFDVVLLGTVTVLLSDLRDKLVCQDPLSIEHRKTWRDWIFEESRRRLAVVLRTINLLVCIEPASMCSVQPGLIFAPLPSKKQLWEASSEQTWRIESAIQSPDFGLANNGELVRLEEHEMMQIDMHAPGALEEKGAGDVMCVYGTEPTESMKGSRNAADWEEWCTGMDGFGALVMLAASLPT